MARGNLVRIRNKSLNHLANQDNTEVGREYIEEAKTLLKSNRYCTIS